MSCTLCRLKNVDDSDFALNFSAWRLNDIVGKVENSEKESQYEQRLYL